MSRHPEVKWAQREDKIYITVLLADAKNPKVNLEPEGVFTFSATAGAENHLYEFKIELQDKVNVEESKINIGVRNIFCVLEKEEKKWWNKLLREGKPPHYVKVDWDKWVDEDEDNGPPSDLDLGGMDFSKFGDMGGMGGMGMPGMGGMGMPGMGGMGMPGMGGMGMPGMGGMGIPGMGGMGMPGMGMGDDAMGNDFDDSDDEEQATKPEESAPETIIEKPKVEGEAAEGKAQAS
ncbi:PREDICTED: uncharacterized protein Os08g0359500-like isoform X1 [Ipomoea nil]|uniref:uncharacterized protein Os08g0359500-like isoform X1 n=1 Tax=Ipomoea nil TaxID=35883 RepID=UPI0009008AB5|nr:PREDICTED: uncharacterized protein Os08g0359500-like isoform X1 [Ipomoea nil]